MTTRLKILSFGLIVSLIVAVTDYVNRNNERPKPLYEIKRVLCLQNVSLISQRLRVKKRLLKMHRIKINLVQKHTVNFYQYQKRYLKCPVGTATHSIKQKQTNMGAEPEILNNRQLEAEQTNG